MTHCGDYISVPRSAITWLKEHYPALCVKAGLCERIAGRLYTKTSRHPLEALHRTQGSFDAAADAYEAEYLQAKGQEARAKSSGFSWDNHNVFGDAASILEVQRLVEYEAARRTSFLQRISLVPVYEQLKLNNEAYDEASPPIPPSRP